MKDLGFKIFVIQFFSLGFTLILVGLKLSGVIDISWIMSSSPLVVTLLAPFVLILCIFLVVGSFILFKKRDVRSNFIKDLKKVVFKK
jgi:uncharacterized membrane protein